MLASLLLLALAALVAVGTTLSYLTDAETHDMEYVVGNVKIKVVEPKWEQANTADSSYFLSKDGTTFSSSLQVGKYIEKDPTVLVDSSSEDCYVRLKLTMDPALSKVIQVPDPANGWVRDDRFHAANTYYYAYPHVLKGGSSSQPAFERILVLSDPEIPPGMTHEELLQAAGKPGQNKLVVVAQAIQAQGVENAERAFQIMDGYFTK